jgi:mono/diheme cytochrome c family protein
MARSFPTVFGACTLLAIVIGCSPKESPTPSPSGATIGGTEPTGPHAAGQRVFNSRCRNCHSVGDAPSGGKKRMGPDLAHVAADPAHTREWLADFIRDPKSHKANAKMPAFGGKLNDQEFKDLLDYLASLK